MKAVDGKMCLTDTLDTDSLLKKYKEERK